MNKKLKGKITVTFCFNYTLAWCRTLECTVLVLILVPFLCTELQEGSHVQYDFRYLGGEYAELGNEPAFQFMPDFFNMSIVYSLLLRKLAIIDV